MSYKTIRSSDFPLIGSLLTYDRKGGPCQHAAFLPHSVHQPSRILSATHHPVLLSTLVVPFLRTKKWMEVYECNEEQA